MIRLSDTGEPAKVDINAINKPGDGLHGKRFISIDIGAMSFILEGFDERAAERAFEISEALHDAARAILKLAPQVPHPALTDDDIPF